MTLNCKLCFAILRKMLIFAPLKKKDIKVESFFRTHKYLVEHLQPSVRRELMDEIDWNDRLIGIKGSRGVGKTTFLLDYAREYYGADNEECLYVNLNHFYFTERTLVDFASEFCRRGGKVLLIDQVFKYPNWSKELKYCYEHLPQLKIVFSGSSVMRLKDENPDLAGKVASYHLRGFSFREYLNLMTGYNFPSYKLADILSLHHQIETEISSKIAPATYFQDYLHHGFYPFFREKRNFSENLLKTMNMTLEVDVLYIKQIEQRYLPKLRKLLYLLAVSAPCSPNVSQLSKEIEMSRATVMNYIKYLADARLVNMLYPVGEAFPKKPSKIYMYNSNLMYPICPVEEVNWNAVRESFFLNQLQKDNQVNAGLRGCQFLVNNKYNFKIDDNARPRYVQDTTYYVVDNMQAGVGNMIPLWLFGFLY